MADKDIIREVLESGLNTYERGLNRRLIDYLLARFRAWPGFAEPATLADERAAFARKLFFFLKEGVAADLEQIVVLRKQHGEFTKRYSRASVLEEKQRHILDFAQDLGASPKQIRGDARSFGRWFGQDAVNDRYERRFNWLERRLTFCLGRLSVLCECLLDDESSAEAQTRLWESFTLEELLGAFFVHEGDSRVCVAAFGCLARALRALPPEIQGRSVQENTLQYIYRSAMYSRQDVWLQCEALALLETLSLSSLQKVLEHRLRKPAPGDDFFVRRRAAQVLLRNLHRMPELEDLLPRVAADPSSFVRQGLAESLVEAPTKVTAHYLGALARSDHVAQVRASAMRIGLKLLDEEELAPRVLEVLLDVLQSEKDPFVLRVAFEVAVEGAAHLVARGSFLTDRWCAESFERLDELHVDAETPAIRRWAGLARERIWCEHLREARSLRLLFTDLLAGLKSGNTRSIRRQVIQSYDDELVGRVLSVLSQDDFGWDVQCRARSLRVTRGHVFSSRLWRMLHEFRYPATDKRQAFPHTVGRIFRGNTRAPSSILAELAQTKVPGEPLFLAEDAGWRPYLPLLDEVLSSLRPTLRPRQVRIYTSEGITEIVPPPSFHRRLSALLILTARFPRYAELRNWRERSSSKPSDYLEALTELGFTFQFHPHGSTEKPTSVDSAVGRFFPAHASSTAFLASFSFFGEFFDAAHEYFVSVYENSLPELALFAVLASGLFIGRHIYLNQRLQVSRSQLPLVVGGWGTRGKSGTERLKAALFNGLGYGLISKTTGCEAMFLYAHPFGKVREMFLFRPYDKATIWEQYNLVELAARLDCEVFLWECMALTPSYVEILQRNWMRDDLATITNTYPDHEDLQGPAGFNIPEVMTRFIPKRSRLLTSEDQMVPLLREAANEVKTTITEITWMDAGLLTPDVLDRFPYDEHPNNIALVLAMADELGVPRDFALKEMADRVVADLGVLKTYPVAKVRGRRLQFVNGMSANERHGCLGNWVRLGFDRQDPVAKPGTWVTTVVNNRADRVPRSKVFAQILVEDLSCDRFFLIGTNLSGLTGFIHETWKGYVTGVRLWVPDSKVSPLESLAATALHFRVPTERAHVLARVRAMVDHGQLSPEMQHQLDSLLEDPETLGERLRKAGLGERADAVVRHLQSWLRQLNEYEEVARKVRATTSEKCQAVEEQFREILWSWFREKLVVVADSHTSGEQLVDRICQETPPGFLNRIMGLQNIKGTGLDFVYRWQAWDACHQACVKLQSDNLARAQEGLKELSTFQEYGLLSEEFVRETINIVKKKHGTRRESIQAELAVLQSNLDVALHHVRHKLQASSQGKTSKVTSLVGAVEGVLDAGDAVKRRRKANRIYEDLVAGRIGYDRAARELQDLNKRQKGGWLIEKLRMAQNVLGRQLAMFYGKAGQP